MAQRLVAILTKFSFYDNATDIYLEGWGHSFTSVGTREAANNGSSDGRDRSITWRMH